LATKKKIGNPQGVKEWDALNTAGDVKRFLRWLVLSMRNHTLDRHDAAVLGQLGCYLLKAIETSDLETRVAALEAHTQGSPT
jgi:hypothetical protein